MIKAVWSAEIKTFSMMTNYQQLNNYRVPLQARVATYDGPEENCKSENVASPSTTKELDKICTEVVKHITDVSGGSTLVSQITLFFKIDSNNKIWLLFCTRAKVRSSMGPKMSNPVGLKKKRIPSPILKCRVKAEGATEEEINEKVKLELGKKEAEEPNDTNTYCCACLQLTQVYKMPIKFLVESKKNSTGLITADFEDPELLKIFSRLLNTHITPQVLARRFSSQGKASDQILCSVCCNCYLLNTNQ